MPHTVGPGGRRHGSRLPQREIQPAPHNSKEARRKGRLEVHELTGDPDVDITEASDAPPHEWQQGLESDAAEKIESFADYAAAIGVREREWNHDEVADEYYGPPSGLSNSTKRNAFDWEMTRGASGPGSDVRYKGRKELEDTSEFLGWSDDLHEDFISKFPDLSANTEAVKKAAKRVVTRWTRQGTRDVIRRVETDRENFLYEVADEIELTPSGMERDFGDEHRTAGTGELGGGGHAYREPEPEQEGGSLTDEMSDFQRKTGYW